MCALTSQELQMLDTMATEFADGELVAGREENDEFPFKPLFSHVLKKADEVGFFSLMLPDEMGGADRSMRAVCAVLREVCRVDASLGAVIFANALAQEILIEAGALEMIDPGQLIATTPFDNPAETGNHAKARPAGDGFLLDGTVEYLVPGGLGGLILVPARIEGEKGLSFFLVDAGREEVAVSEPVVSIGLHACPAVDIKLRGAPASLIGKPSEGELYLDRAIARLGVACAAMAAGVMRGSFDTALEYARERSQGGRTIVNWSQVRMTLADMAVRIKCADLVVDAASRAADEAEEGWQQASRAAALSVCPIACDVTSDGIQLLGGNGYMHEYGQEKRFRDAQHIQMLTGMPLVRKLSYIGRILEGENC